MREFLIRAAIMVGIVGAIGLFVWLGVTFKCVLPITFLVFVLLMVFLAVSDARGNYLRGR
jgi:hypothetical protein